MEDTVIQADGLTKFYRMGEVEVQALRGRIPAGQARRSRGHHGAFRFRKNHPDEHPGLPRPANQRRVHPGW